MSTKNLFQLSPAASALSLRERRRCRGRFLLPNDRWLVFSPLPFAHRGRLSCFVLPVCLLAPLIVPPRSTCFPLTLLFSPCSLAANRLSFARQKNAYLRPLPRVRASCARASRVSNNCLHFFTQCAQPLDMERFAVKANCRVFRFT